MEVKINPETPSEAVIKAANATVTVKDSTGRSITIRRLRTLDRVRMLELIGSDNAKNEEYKGYVALAYSVTDIDGIPVPTLGTKLQFEALVQRLDDHGFDAVAKGVTENFMPTEQADSEARDAVKNV